MEKTNSLLFKTNFSKVGNEYFSDVKIGSFIIWEKDDGTLVPGATITNVYKNYQNHEMVWSLQGNSGKKFKLYWKSKSHVYVKKSIELRKSQMISTKLDVKLDILIEILSKDPNFKKEFDEKYAEKKKLMDGYYNTVKKMILDKRDNLKKN